MKYDKVIVGPLLVNCYFPTLCWGQVDLRTPDLRLTAYPLYAFSTWESMKISYLRKIEYVVYVPISSPQHTLMGTHRKLGINVRFQSPSIVKYLDLLWRIYIRPVCCFFYNEHFQALGGFDVPEITPGNYVECIKHFMLRIMY